MKPIQSGSAGAGKASSLAALGSLGLWAKTQLKLKVDDGVCPSQHFSTFSKNCLEDVSSDRATAFDLLREAPWGSERGPRGEGR